MSNIGNAYKGTPSDSAPQTQNVYGSSLVSGSLDLGAIWIQDLLALYRSQDPLDLGSPMDLGMSADLGLRLGFKLCMNLRISIKFRLCFG